ncbi:MAG: HNH endonuclease [Chloroflexi bacterium]|nr:MAG: HNH endonuclease [Chloroflexota bacterium]
MKEVVVNDLTNEQWLEIQEVQKHKCYYCGNRCKGHLTQDHIIPLVRGGGHTLHNVIAACKACNSKKQRNHAPIPVQPLLLTLAPAKKQKD